MLFPAPYTEIAAPQDANLSPAPHGVQGSAPWPPSPLTSYELMTQNINLKKILAGGLIIPYYNWFSKGEMEKSLGCETGERSADSAEARLHELFDERELDVKLGTMLSTKPC